MKKKFKVAIVGCGGISKVHANAWRDSDQIDLVAACDDNVQALKSFVDQFEVPNSYLDLRTLLESQKLDVLVITTWPSSHLKNVLEAVRAKVKKVLCEKPLAINTKQVEQMIQVVRKLQTNNTPVLLTEAFMYRHHPLTQEVRSKICDGKIGELRSINLVFNTGLTDQTNWRLRGDLGGGTMMDLGCYCIDLINYLIDQSPRSVYATGNYSYGTNAWETMYAIIRYNDRLVAQIDTGFGMCWREYYEIVGSEGVIRVNPAWGNNVGECQFWLNDQPVVVEGLNPYLAEILNLCHAESQSDLIMPLTDSLRNMKLIDAVHESAHAGQIVQFID